MIFISCVYFFFFYGIKRASVKVRIFQKFRCLRSTTPCTRPSMYIHVQLQKFENVLIGGTELLKQNKELLFTLKYWFQCHWEEYLFCSMKHRLAVIIMPATSKNQEVTSWPISVRHHVTHQQWYNDDTGSKGQRRTSQQRWLQCSKKGMTKEKLSACPRKRPNKSKFLILLENRINLSRQ